MIADPVPTLYAQYLYSELSMIKQTLCSKIKRIMIHGTSLIDV